MDEDVMKKMIEEFLSGLDKRFDLQNQVNTGLTKGIGGLNDRLNIQMARMDLLQTQIDCLKGMIDELKKGE